MYTHLRRRAVLIGTLSIASLLALTVSASAWTGPTASPPNGNVSAPINVGSTGQVKAGDFATQGKMGVGTPSPSASYRLDVYNSATGVWKGYFHGPDGGISIGPANSGWAHIYSDAGNSQPFIFNTDVYSLTNGFSSYNSNLLLKTGGTTRLTVTTGGALTIGAGYSSNWANLNIPAGNSINAGGTIYSYSAVCVGMASGNCTGAGGTRINGTGVTFPDGTTQTTAAAASSDTLQSVTNRGYTTSQPIISTYDVRAPIFYDQNNTGYYVDPSSMSNMERVDFSYGYDRNNTGYYIDLDNRTNLLNLTANGDVRATIFYDQNNTGYYVDPSSTSRLNYGIYDNLYSYGWMQSPIFYDANDNSYYVDPNGTSIFNAAYANAFYYNSDRRLKKDIQPLGNTLDKVLQLEPVTYAWKDTALDQSTQVGFIAQDVEKLFPELVTTSPKDGMKAVDYSKVGPLLVEALKEQEQKIAEQQRQLDELRNEIEALKK